MTKSLAAALEKALRPAKQLRFAAEQALGDTAFAARKAVQEVMPQVFDRPTPFILSGVKVRLPRDIRSTSEATQAAGLGPGKFGTDALVAVVSIDDYGRGKGAAPEDVLRAEVAGGSRGFKGAERRLQSVGLMSPGFYMVPSQELLSQGNLVDAYGNVRGSFIRSLLSYLQAFSTPGFTANMSPRTRDRIAARGKNERGFASINGVQYFVSKGRGERNSRMQHLPPGIWAKRGTGGSRIYPVFLFVANPQYKVRLRFGDIVSNVAEREFPRRFAERAARAFATAR
jgi:hypothetical protein